MTCDRCKYVLEEGINKETLKRHLRCRRFPPTCFIGHTPNGTITIGEWPPTQGEFWCGEFAPMETRQ